MALFPKIQSPCPYKGNLTDIMDGDLCRLCKRQVFDLTEMSDGERVAFMQSCSTEVCVSYRVLAAVAVTAASLLVPTAALACDVTTVVVTGGGITDPAHVQYVQYDTADKRTPALPVLYEDAPSDKAPARSPVKVPAAP